jgi:hypothetical protein
MMVLTALSFRVDDRLASKRTQEDAPVLPARERNTELLQFKRGGHSFATRVFDRVLVSEPIQPRDHVMHVEMPVITAAHVAREAGRSTLSRNGVASRGNTLVRQAVLSAVAAIP